MLNSKKKKTILHFLLGVVRAGARVHAYLKECSPLSSAALCLKALCADIRCASINQSIKLYLTRVTRNIVN